MIKRLMTLLVVSAMFFSGVKAAYKTPGRKNTIEKAIDSIKQITQSIDQEEAAMLQTIQTSLSQFSTDMASTDFTLYGWLEACPINSDEPCSSQRVAMGLDKDALSTFISNFMTDYCNGIVEAIAATLEQHYTIDRAALGL